MSSFGGSHTPVLSPIVAVSGAVIKPIPGLRRWPLPVAVQQPRALAAAVCGRDGIRRRHLTSHGQVAGPAVYGSSTVPILLRSGRPLLQSAPSSMAAAAAELDDLQLAPSGDTVTAAGPCDTSCGHADA